MHIGEDIDGEEDYDRFGVSISLNTDGNIVAIGGIGNDNNGSNSGHVRIFDLSSALSTKDKTVLDFKIYPNPVKDQFSIQLKNILELENVNIYNNLGQLVLTSNETTINSSKLSTGLYIVEIQTTRGKASKKLIIE